MSTSTRKDLFVSEVMLPLDSCPVATKHTILKEVLYEMNIHKLGVVCIVDGEMKLSGIITEGDFRRKILQSQKPLAALLADDVVNHAIKTPISVSKNFSLVDAVLLMSEKKVWDLPVVDQNKTLIGLLHLHHAIAKIILGKPGII